MKYWALFFGILIASPLFAQCKIDQQQFGVSSTTIENKLKGQVVAVMVTIIWSGVVTFIAIKIADVLCGGIRSDGEVETEGLDLADHGEDGYHL